MMVTPATTETAREAHSIESPASRGAARRTGASAAHSLSAYLRETLPLDLGELAQDVVAQMLTEGLLDGVDIHYHLPDEAVSVELPRRQFSHIVELMLATSAEAMRAVKDKRHVLRVIVEPADPFGDYGPRLRVQDTGASILVEDSLRETVERAETLGTALTVKSRPTGGNLFTVELPAAQVCSW